MINLLPPEEKRKILLKKKEKLAVIFAIVFLVFLICLILILLSVKFYILAETDYQKNNLIQVEQSKESSDLVEFGNIIQAHNGTLDQLDSFYKKEIYFNEALDIILNVPKPENLYLTNFSLDRSRDSMIEINVTGISESRDNLLIFKNNIEQDENIQNSYFSSESWISPKNAKFSLTFEISKNEKQ
jgi:hypothetical protein